MQGAKTASGNGSWCLDYALSSARAESRAILLCVARNQNQTASAVFHENISNSCNIHKFTVLSAILEMEGDGVQLS